MIGSGYISGKFSGNGSSETERNRVYVIRAEDVNKEVRTIVLDAEKVTVKPCASESDCSPTAEFRIAENPLWVKETGTQQRFPLKDQAPDKTSIWLGTGIHNGSAINNTRLDVVNKVSLKIGDEPAATGGPDLPGRVISSLSNRVILTLPPSAIQ